MSRAACGPAGKPHRDVSAVSAASDAPAHLADQGNWIGGCLPEPRLVRSVPAGLVSESVSTSAWCADGVTVGGRKN